MCRCVCSRIDGDVPEPGIVEGEGRGREGCLRLRSIVEVESGEAGRLV